MLRLCLCNVCCCLGDLHTLFLHAICLQDKKQLKALMLALSAHESVDHGDADGPPALDDPIAASKGAKSGFGQYKEAAFVFTDIENSTDLSQQNRAAFLQVRAHACQPRCLTVEAHVASAPCSWCAC